MSSLSQDCRLVVVLSLTSYMLFARVQGGCEASGRKPSTITLVPPAWSSGFCSFRLTNCLHWLKSNMMMCCHDFSSPFQCCSSSSFFLNTIAECHTVIHRNKIAYMRRAWRHSDIYTVNSLFLWGKSIHEHNARTCAGICCVVVGCYFLLATASGSVKALHLLSTRLGAALTNQGFITGCVGVGTFLLSECLSLAMPIHPKSLFLANLLFSHWQFKVSISRQMDSFSSLLCIHSRCYFCSSLPTQESVFCCLHRPLLYVFIES